MAPLVRPRRSDPRRAPVLRPQVHNGQITALIAQKMNCPSLFPLLDLQKEMDTTSRLAWVPVGRV